MLNVKRVVLWLLIWSNVCIWCLRILIRQQSQTGYFYCKGGSTQTSLLSQTVISTENELYFLIYKPTWRKKVKLIWSIDCPMFKLMYVVQLVSMFLHHASKVQMLVATYSIPLSDHEPIGIDAHYGTLLVGLNISVLVVSVCEVWPVTVSRFELTVLKLVSYPNSMGVFHGIILHEEVMEFSVDLVVLDHCQLTATLVTVVVCLLELHFFSGQNLVAIVWHWAKISPTRLARSWWWQYKTN